ncbi:U32 family peptidase [Caloranaerobacter azorensis]|uniref:U32 family peptidase n=1 Tax=Caloranaerobacter azorensis TaxID=116090 RepID=A0A6P1YDJ4_9FIRM|nr:U32 family peptidase [Caloranaerobacter azorensis]
MVHVKEKVELLAPVGSIESLYAAVENGADAVYLGGKMFNARQYASNFDREELKKAVEYAHIKDVKVYVTVNILLSDSEFKEALEYISFLYNIDVDAIIIQDLGLASLVKKLLPDFEIHGSTQMTIINQYGAKFLEELGFTRVVLGRELSLKEIKYIKDETNIELEGFIHGALCISYSGQCLMSSIIGGRSGNRGRCAQPCRMPYTLVNAETGQIVSQKLDKKFLLSTRDLNTIEDLNMIIKSGIISLKIEGRMKRPEYVAVIVSKYRKALDNLYNRIDRVISKEDKKELLQIFNRKFTRGYILGDFGRDLVAIDRPDNRGVYIGRVIDIDKKYIYILLEDSLHVGDGIEITDNKGNKDGIVVNSIFSKGKQVKSCREGEIAKIKRIGNIKKDSKVYKTSDVLLLENAKKSFTERDKLKKIDIYMEVEIKIGHPIKMFLWDDRGNYVTIVSEERVQEGENIYLTEEKVIKQLSKLGGTHYVLKDINVKLENNSMIPVSVLNKLRREAIEELNRKRAIINKRIEINEKDILNKMQDIIEKSKPYVKTNNRLISVSIQSFKQFAKIDLNKLDRVYISYYEGVNESIKEIKKYGKEVYLQTERILTSLDFKTLNRQIRDIGIENIDGISVSNLGTLKYIKDNFDTNIHCDIGINAYNSFTMKFLEEYGVKSVTLSPELKLSQIKNICLNTNLICETIGYGYLPVMISKYCPFSIIKGCLSDRECDRCKFRYGYGLKDRLGKVFRIVRKGKVTTIYNSQPLVVIENLKEIYNSKVDMIRLDFTFEDDIKEIQTMYYEFANDNIDEKNVVEFINKIKKSRGLTKGHYYRGVL